MEINTHTIISTYEEALASLRDEKAQEVLILRMMRLGQQIWDEKVIRQRWQRYSQQHPLSYVLWQRFADSCLTGLDFQYDDVQGLYLTRLGFLQAKRVQFAADWSHCDDEIQKRRQKSLENLMYASQVQTLLRFTLFLRDAGYIERGIATWQAVLELSFCYPSELGDSRRSNAGDFETILKSLEDFWENGAPRIGEEGACGWSSYSEDTGSSWMPRIDAVKPAQGASTTWSSWMGLEREASFLDAMPARYEDETHEEDNARIIMFSDIKRALFSSLDDDSTTLLNAFLTFCNLPSLGESHWKQDAATIKTQQDSQGNPFMQGHLLNKISGSSAKFSLNTITQSNTLQYKFTPESYLSPEDWFSPFSVLSDTKSNLAIQNFAFRVLAQL
ncbi:MAG: hypothetical protein Q9164_007536, partial [Protoblastenia rupestris]